MKKINFLNKFIAFSLAFIFIILSIPLQVVFANLQSNIKNLKITSADEENGYSINLSWENPSWSQSTDSAATDGDIIHTPQGYRVYQRKATTSSTSYDVIKEETGTDLTALKLSSLQLKDGTIYEYSVVPYHTHTYSTNTGFVSKDAPMDSSTKQESVLFMTDIQVEAVGSGNTLTVTFDNPKYNGKDIFTAYNIYYQKGGSNATTFNSVITVNIDNSDLIASYDSIREVHRLTYQITNNNIEQGNVYAVKVEPILNGREVRDSSINDLTISVDGNIQKRLAFNSKSFREYRTDEAHVSIPLSILEDGKQFLKLNWGDLSGVTPVGDIESISIYYGESETSIYNLLSTIYSQDAINVNSWRVNRPTETTYYQIKVKIVGISEPLLSEIAVYNPSIVNITPNTPEVFTKVNISDNKSVLDLYWEAFIRPAYTSAEESLANSSGLIIDRDVYYDVWISDSIENLESLGLPKILDKVFATELKETFIEDSANPVFYSSIKKYYTVDSSGSFIEKEIEENKIYYIRIVATKPTSDGLGLSSLPADTQIYVPARGDISTPNTLSKPPLSIKKDSNGIEMIEQENITIQWNTQWFEIYDEQTEKWYSSAAIRNGVLVFGDEIQETDSIVNFYDLASSSDVKQAIKQAGYSDSENLLVREIDINQDNIKYELIVKSLDEINYLGGYDSYIESLLNNDSSDWQDISPTFESKYAYYTLTGLSANTRYAILLRPYRILTDGRKEAYPNYILATTLPKEQIIVITPTTPNLYEISKTDVSINVSWKEEVSGLSYELAIDEVTVDDPAKAKILISSQDIKDGSIYHSSDDETYIEYSITNLFPETGYYIWIRAIVDNTGKASGWSSPIYVKTEEIKAPQPPSGFGLASDKSIDTYNANNNTDYMPTDYDYLILEWLRDINDLREPVTPSSVDNAQALIDSSLTSTYMVKFNNLLANKTYYARAKTIIYVSKLASGSSETVYSYVIQLSLREDFKDAIEIEVPAISITGSDKILMKESKWTTTYSFVTDKSVSSGDYDGNFDNEVYPLPNEDFEVYYQSDTKTLIYRFRRDSKDGNGNYDNYVDQRFITNLINSQTYNYQIDLTSHLGYTISNRKVEIPYSILSAFEERKISLTLVTNGTTFKLNPAFLNTAEVKQLGQLGDNTTVSICISQNVSSTPATGYYQTYTSIPQEISIYINRNGVSTPISYLGSEMNVVIKVNDRTAVLDQNVSIYKDTEDTLTWQKMNSIYNSEQGTMASKTNELGNYVTIASGVRNTDSTESLVAVNSKIVLTDLTNADLNSSISVVQFNNIIAGIANGKTEISVNNALSTQDYTSLSRAGMLSTGSVISREAAINILVKLYEIKTKYVYTSIDNINTTPFGDIKNATSAYQTNLIKAGELGFFGSETLARPKDIITIEEVLYIVNIILEDSGY